MKILVIGGNRFVGKSLTNELVLRNNDVDIFNRRGIGFSSVNIIQGDRNDINDLKKLILNYMIV